MEAQNLQLLLLHTYYRLYIIITELYRQVFKMMKWNSHHAFCNTSIHLGLLIISVLKCLVCYNDTTKTQKLWIETKMCIVLFNWITV